MVDLRKPARGTFRKERATRARNALGRERYEKGKVRTREARQPALRGPCRWPHEDLDDVTVCRRSPKEVAHMTHKGMGGDTRTIRSRRHRMLQVCKPTHRKIDRKLAKVDYLDPPNGTDGPLVFLERLAVTDDFMEIRRELSPGLLERRA
jgi:hypothetical protein